MSVYPCIRVWVCVCHTEYTHYMYLCSDCTLFNNWTFIVPGSATFPRLNIIDDGGKVSMVFSLLLFPLQLCLPTAHTTLTIPHYYIYLYIYKNYTFIRRLLHLGCLFPYPYHIQIRYAIMLILLLPFAFPFLCVCMFIYVLLRSFICWFGNVYFFYYEQCVHLIWYLGFP